jgi:hypothetical protein
MVPCLPIEKGKEDGSQARKPLRVVISLCTVFRQEIRFKVFQYWLCLIILGH